MAVLNAGWALDGVGTGAGHGGWGGSHVMDTNGGDYYGWTRDPENMGSGGGNSATGVGGAGGAFVTLKVAVSFEMDGKNI